MFHPSRPGDVCPQGAYCPEGSASPTLCGPGYYLNSTRNNDTSDCRLCTPGWYCAGHGNPTPTAECTAGYYCPSGQEEATPAAYNCTQGKYCLIEEVIACFGKLLIVHKARPRGNVTF